VAGKGEPVTRQEFDPGGRRALITGPAGAGPINGQAPCGGGGTAAIA